MTPQPQRLDMSRGGQPAREALTRLAVGVAAISYVALLIWGSYEVTLTRADAGLALFVLLPFLGFGFVIANTSISRPGVLVGLPIVAVLTVLVEVPGFGVSSSTAVLAFPFGALVGLVVVALVFAVDSALQARQRSRSPR